jgi:hypothetical protein
MSFFRSEEHLRNWEGFGKGIEQGLIPLVEVMRLFSARYFKNRMEPDYMSHYPAYAAEFVDLLQSLEGAGKYWSLGRMASTLMPIARRLGLM